MNLTMDEVGSPTYSLPKPKPKVLIYTSLFPNSVHPIHGHFIYERMRHLSAFLDMTVVAPVPYFPRINVNDSWFKLAKVPRTESFDGFNIDHPRYLVVPKIGMSTHGISMFTGSLVQVRKLLRTVDYDLIDAHYVYPDGLAAVMLGALFNKPVVVTARGSDINLFPKLGAIRPFIRQVLTRADGLIAVTQSLKDVMVRLGCRDEKITVIGNGVDPVKFSPLEKSEARRALGLPVDRQIVLSVGHLIELKGFHILIEAIARLRRIQPDVLLLIIGEGPLSRPLERQIQDLGIQDHVKLIGARRHRELNTWYSAADVFCLASSSEGCANVVLEAMACGRPVIATDIPGTREVVTLPSLGTLVERTPESFKDAIGVALQKNWDHDHILTHTRSQGWDTVAGKVLKVYSEVLARRGK